MSQMNTLKAELRTRAGKGSSRQLRKQGLIPAVIYGDKKAPIAIAVAYKDIYYKIYGGGFKTTVFNIELDKKKIAVLPKDYQLDPVKDQPLHVDFLRITSASVVEVEVPINYLNSDSVAGVKLGGHLNIISHTITCSVNANAIPESIKVDVANMNIGDTLHVSDIQLPEGVTISEHATDQTLVMLQEIQLKLLQKTQQNR
ncbi:50S ribosomal protein L25/general stress protein Ctc [Bartonella sp. DGB1]|uniref:50S ribosomal protein L25/general stress protein Ctc n=1 Tax=Bartonella sp. DGB1 TaxID=3239807 RepID=UPI00352589E9